MVAGLIPINNYARVYTPKSTTAKWYYLGYCPQHFNQGQFLISGTLKTSSASPSAAILTVKGSTIPTLNFLVKTAPLFKVGYILDGARVAVYIYSEESCFNVHNLFTSGFVVKFSELSEMPEGLTILS